MLALTTRLFAVPWVSAATFWLHVAVAVVALSRNFAGVGQLRLFLLAAVILPLLRLVFDRNWRTRRIEQARGWWNACADPIGGERGKWLAGLVFVGGPAAFVYCLQPFFAISSGDSWPVVPTAASLVREGNAEVSEFVAVAPPEHFGHGHSPDPLPYGLEQTRFGVFSHYPVGMTLFALPSIAVGRVCGADFDSPAAIMKVERWAAVLVAVGVLAAFFRVGLLVGSRRAVLLVTILLAVGSAVYSTLSQALWQHGGVMLGLLALFATELHPSLKRSAWGRVLFGAAVGVMFACRLSAVPSVAVVGLWTLLANPKRGLLNAVAAALGAAPWVGYYVAVYGSPLGPSANQASGGLWTANIGPPLLGLLVSPSRGLLVYQPWVPFALAGLFLRPRAGWKWAAAGVAVVHLMLISAWGVWWGGSCWGSRLLCEMLVPLGLLAVPVADRVLRWRWGVAAVVGLVALSAVPQAAGVWLFRLSANWDAFDERTMWNPPAWGGRDSGENPLGGANLGEPAGV